MAMFAFAFSAVAVQAATWTIFHEDHVPVKDGVAQGSATMTGVEQLTNALTQVANGDTVIVKPGVYDLSALEPMTVSSYSYCYLCARDANGAVRQAKIVLKGENEKSWREKTPEEEAVFRGDDRATIFYAHGAGGRPTSIYNISFERGKRPAMSGIGSFGGGAISWAATEQFSLKNMTGLASNCVFRSCSSVNYGGGTYGPHVFDSLYTNCTATTGGGGAYGMCNDNSQKKAFNTNTFDRCVFVDCSSDNGGAIYAREMTSLSGCAFIGCRATSVGAGVYAANPLKYAGDCTFTNCIAGNDGCGLKVSGNLGLLTNCTFMVCRSTGQGNGGAVNTRNGARDDKIEKVVGCTFSDCWAGWGGGAIFADHLGEIVNCTFTGNGANSSGGAAYSGNAIDRVANSTFVGNVSTNAGGGAFLCQKAIGPVTDCVFSNNVANGLGGAFRTESSCASIERCVFVGNVAAKQGGGCSVKTDLPLLADCEFRANSSGIDGGGAQVAGALPIVTNCVFVGNLATNGTGGAISTDQHLGAVTDCTFAENVAKSAAGVYTAIASGVYTNCTFLSNTNPPTAYGAHANLAHDMIHCRFSGYGDVGAKNYDGCVFSNCVYQYTERAYGSDHHGLMTYPYALGDGTIRNCLVCDCTVSRILATQGVRTDVANCTFVNNYVDDDPPEGNGTHAIMFFAFRNGNGSSGIPSTNVMVNCIFADNRVRGQKSGKACDLYCSGSVSPVGHSIVRNCLYKNADSVVWGNGSYESSDLNPGDPKFVAGNPKYPDAPHYMIRHSSAASGKGVRESWMAEAADLAGTAYPAEGPVDLGCYQCNLPSIGGLLLLR